MAHVLIGKPASTPDQVRGRLFPEHALGRAVRAFQQQAGHRFADGKVGPGTRGLIVRALAERSLQAFLRLPDPPVAAEGRPPIVAGGRQGAKRLVFLSYAHLNAHKVDPIDGWLRDKQVSVIRDSF